MLVLLSIHILKEFDHIFTVIHISSDYHSEFYIWIGQEDPSGNFLYLYKAVLILTLCMKNNRFGPLAFLQLISM